MRSVPMPDPHSLLALRPRPPADRALDKSVVRAGCAFGARYRRLGLVLILATPLLGGCAAMVLGGAAVGVAASHDRRAYDAFMQDQEIEMRAMTALTEDPETREHTRIAITSYNRTVLLTGEAESQVLRDRAAEIVSRLPRVARVVDEVTVGPSISLWRQTEDTYVTSRAKLALTNINMPGFDATRVKVVTESGVVYLLGLVTQEEGDAAAEKVRFVPGVERVVKLFEYQEPKA
jgi:osmotically-inducible protein OsmY